MKNHTKYWQNFATLILVTGLLLSVITAANAESIDFEQLPGHFGGLGSDGPIMIVADEFSLPYSTQITNITWWGGYFEENMSTPPEDNFTILFYEDAGGKPGTLVQTFAAGNMALRIATGNYVNPPDPENGFFSGYPEFEYSFDLPVAFAVQEDTLYWLGITGVTSSGVSWLWEASDSLTNLGVQRSFESGPWEPFFHNTSFRLETSGGVRPLSVTIDIKPDSFPNHINPGSHGKIPVAILSSATFDAPSQVDKTSLTFGRIGNEPSLVAGSCHKEDVNRDRLPDLLCKFSIPATGFQIGTILGKLQGFSITGVPLRGTDTIQTVSYP